jgi:hypothetical protein
MKWAREEYCWLVRYVHNNMGQGESQTGYIVVMQLSCGNDEGVGCVAVETEPIPLKEAYTTDDARTVDVECCHCTCYDSIRAIEELYL